jgi:tetratricopeptide (TPR) repeat protein
MRMTGWIRGGLTAGLLVAAALPACREQSPPAATASSPLAAALKGMSPQAQIDTLRAIAIAKPNDAQVAFLAGNAFYARGSELGSAEQPRVQAYLDSATAAYRHAVIVDSTLSKAWVNLGLVLQDLNQRPQAQQAFEKAIAVNPRDVLAYCHLGYLHQSIGNVEEGIVQYRRALAIDPNSAQAHYNLGLAFADAKIFAEALREWETVVRLDPDGDLGITAAENVKIIRQYLDAKP